MRTTIPTLIALLAVSLITPGCPDGKGEGDNPDAYLTETHEIEEDYEATWAEIQDVIQEYYSTPDDALLRNYKFRAHAKTTVTGCGYTMARKLHIDEWDDGGSFNPYRPTLLFYAPTGPATGSWLFRDADYADFLLDAPYELIGWAYSYCYDPDDQPSLSGVPSEAWFVHEAGFHNIATGDMTLTPPEEDYPGQVVAEEPEGTGWLAGLTWHERCWDLHVWSDPDGVPILSIFEPFDQLPPSDETLTLPDGSFFYPEEG